MIIVFALPPFLEATRTGSSGSWTKISGEALYISIGSAGSSWPLGRAACIPLRYTSLPQWGRDVIGLILVCKLFFDLFIGFVMHCCSNIHLIVSRIVLCSIRYTNTLTYLSGKFWFKCKVSWFVGPGCRPGQNNRTRKITAEVRPSKRMSGVFAHCPGMMGLSGQRVEIQQG